MNEFVEKLLQPVSAEQPCGPDLAYDARLGYNARFEELETILKGKPEVEIGSVQKPAEPPNWGELKDKSVEFLGASKNLRVAVILCCTLTKTAGVSGFRDGIELIRGLLDQQWPGVYPVLDAEDNNDPTQRLNILGTLTAPRGSIYTSWLRTIDYLCAAPLCQPKGLPPVTLEQLQAAREKEKGGAAAADVPDLGKLTAALRNAGSDQIAATHKIIQESQEAARGIDQFLTNTLGAGGAISFEELHKTLQEMAGALQPFMAGAATTGDGSAGGEAGSGDDGSSGSIAGIQIRGAIRSPEDVVRAIDGICEYYRQVEPSSPVPFLLRRAQKLALMNFVQAVQELNLGNVDALRPSMGAGLDGIGDATTEAPAA